MNSARGATSQKQALRAELRSQRKSVPKATRIDAAVRAARILARHRWFREARHIGVYLPTGSELSTLPLLHAIWRSGRSAYVPRIGRRGQMQFVALYPRSPLRRNRHGIEEPTGRQIRPPRRLDLLVIPLLGFTATGQRLGAGGGYYDRLLARCAPGRPRRVGYAYECQHRDELPAEPWDQGLHGVATECRLRRCR